MQRLDVSDVVIITKTERDLQKNLNTKAIKMGDNTKEIKLQIEDENIDQLKRFHYLLSKTSNGQVT